MNRRLVGVLFAVLLSGGLACGDSPTEPTSTEAEVETATAVTETFSNAVLKGGATSRSFITTDSGMITIVLTSLSQDTAFVGLALGLSDEVTGVCTRTYAIVTQVYSARALSANADKGRYCVVVYDVGDFTDSVTFTVSVTHF